MFRQRSIEAKVSSSELAGIQLKNKDCCNLRIRVRYDSDPRGSRPVPLSHALCHTPSVTRPLATLDGDSHPAYGKELYSSLGFPFLYHIPSVLRENDFLFALSSDHFGHL